MTDYSYQSPRDRWLAFNPDKTPEDWAELVKEGMRKKELAQLDGRAYPSEAERKRRQNERQRLCRKRRKERQEAERAATEAENAELRERIKELESCIRGDAEGIYRLAKNTGYLHTDELMESIHNRMRELGVEV